MYTRSVRPAAGERLAVSKGRECGERLNRVMKAKIPLVLDPQPEGGYTVTSPLLPELITEGDTMIEALGNVEDAFCAVVEIYQDRGCSLPSSLFVEDANGPLSVETIVSVP